jgi:hypothetical protein
MGLRLLFFLYFVTEYYPLLRYMNYQPKRCDFHRLYHLAD